MNGLIEVPYQPPCSVWGIISKILPSTEHEAVRSILGPSLVDQADDLHAEIRNLLEIWETFSEEAAKRAIFLDQSALKDRLIKEVTLLLDIIKDRADKEGKCIEELLEKHNPKVVQFCCSGQSTSRPTSSRRSNRNSNGWQTPMMSVDEKNLDHVEQYNSSVETKMKLLEPKLNIANIANVLKSLRQLLENEIRQLKEDVQFLHQCLEDPEAEPSLCEIRDERNRLESEILYGSSPSLTDSDTMMKRSGKKILLEPINPNDIKTNFDTFRVSVLKSSPKLESLPTVTVLSNPSQDRKLTGSPTNNPVKLNKADRLRALVDSAKM